MNKRCDLKIWSKVVNKSWEQWLWTIILNKSFEQNLLTGVLNKSCKQKIKSYAKVTVTHTFEQKLRTKFLNKSCELIRHSIFVPLYLFLSGSLLWISLCSSCSSPGWCELALPACYSCSYLIVLLSSVQSVVMYLHIIWVISLIMRFLLQWINHLDCKQTVHLHTELRKVNHSVEPGHVMILQKNGSNSSDQAFHKFRY